MEELHRFLDKTLIEPELLKKREEYLRIWRSALSSSTSDGSV